MRDIFISGGFTNDFRAPITRVQKLNTHTEEYDEMPALIKARKFHASIVGGQYLFAFGGQTTGQEFSRSIEMLSLRTCQAWEMLIEDDENVERIY